MSDAGDLSNFSMLDLFRVEVETQVAVLSDGLLTLERDVGAADLESLMRAAHSIKGAARMVGVAAATQLAHDMEDYFVAVQGDRFRIDPSHLDVLFTGIDLLVRISQLQDGEADGWLADNRSQLDRVQKALAAISRGETVEVDGTDSTGTSTRTDAEDAVAVDPADAGAVAASVGEPVAGTEPEPVDKSFARMDAPSLEPEADDQAKPGAGTGARAAKAGESEGEARSTAEADRVVRVTAENLNRLMGLAGEALVGTRWLQPFAESLQQLKAGQAEVAQAVEAIKSAVEAGADGRLLAPRLTNCSVEPTTAGSCSPTA